MRRKNRKPIASIKKLPQFTTMNVIDGQAGLENYSRLIFYSLTIDNILNIIILLILAGITIGALTGENGIIKNAGQSKEQTEIANEKEILEKATVEAMGKNKYGNIEESELQNALNQETGEGKTEAVDAGEEFEVLFIDSNRYYIVDKDGNVGEVKDYYKDENPGDITIGENGETLDGSEEHPYEIWCIEDLVAFSNMSNGEGIRLENGKPVTITKAEAKDVNVKYIVLKSDLNFKSRLSYADSERTDFGDINGNVDDGNTLMNEMTTGTGFRPIGNGDNIDNRFKGNFNGNYKKINNIYENVTNRNLGLFSVVQSTTIQNLSIQGEFTVYNENNNYTNSPAAGVVAFSWGTSSFKNCSSNVNIDSNGYGAGGIVGRAYNTVEIINCSNLGKIENSSESTGGIAGRMEGTTNIYNSFNAGEISSSGQQVGGIVGYCVSSVNLENVYNCGELSKNGMRGRGGIVGAIGNIGTVDINSSYNIGKVIEEELNYSSGAICGYRYDVSKENLKINNSYYLSNTCSVAVGNEDDSGYGVTKLESMTNEELKNYLNEYKEKNNQGDWKNWKIVENGYPTFE